jgi:hypothetical protein
MGRALDLDHIGAEPRQHLGAGGAGLIMGKVDDPNACESLIHLDSPSPFDLIGAEPMRSLLGDVP